MPQLQPMDSPRREESENRGAVAPASDYLEPFGWSQGVPVTWGGIPVFVTIGLQALRG